jgi:hypothetical protein
MSTLLPAFSLCQIREVHSMDDYGNKYQKVFFEDCDLIYFEREYKVKDGFWNRYVILKQEGNWYQGDDNFQNIAFKTQSRGVHMYRKNDSRWRVRQIAGETNGIKWVKIRLQMDDGLEEVVKDGLTGWTINVSKANAVVDGHAQAELLPYRISKQLSYALEIFYQNNF